MPAYSYTALSLNGEKKKGVLSAQSEREARRLVKELNLTPVNIQEAKGNLSRISKVKNKDIVIMTRQLATLLEANTPIIDAGNLDVIFEKLADYLEESASTRQKVISALTYPIILIGFSIVVIISLLAFVLPQVVGQFVKAGAELPFITKALLGVSNNIVLITIILIIVILGIAYLYKQFIKKADNQIRFHKYIISFPMIGNFMLISEIERFSTTMTLLLESGSNLDIALDEASKIFKKVLL